jgi:hypothetical protein
VNRYTYNTLTKEYTLVESGPKVTVNMTYKAPVSMDEMVQFVDKTGNAIADGTVINVDKGEVDVFGDLLFPTGLSIENVSENDIYVSISYEIKSLPNGVFQICFPQNCVQKGEQGKFATQQGSMSATAQKDLQAEWIPEENNFGTCTVELQVNTYIYNALTKQYTIDEEGPKVTVNMTYKDPASVDNLETNKAQETARYNLAGQRVSEGQKGVNIVKYDNGKTVKKVKK